MLHFRRADAVRQRAEGAMRGGMAVAANDGHAGQRKALLRADNVDDALADIVLGVIFDAEFGRIPGQRLDLDAAFLVLDAELAVRRGRHVVVDDGERPLRMAHGAAGHAQALESLRAGHFVHEVTVNVEQAGAVVLAVDDVVVEYLVVEGARCAHMRKSVDLFRNASVRPGGAGAVNPAEAGW